MELADSEPSMLSTFIRSRCDKSLHSLQHCRGDYHSTYAAQLALECFATHAEKGLFEELFYRKILWLVDHVCTVAVYATDVRSHC